MPLSLVLELQRLAQDSSTSITELLRRAKVVSIKLRLNEAVDWINHETSGYPSRDTVPTYRIVPSELKQKNRFRGWQTVLWPGANPIQEHFSRDYLTVPIAELERLLGSKEGGVLLSPLDQGEIDVLLRLGNEQLLMTGEVARVYPPSALVRIVEAVRTKILEFALELEQRGVLGEGMTFSDEEKRGATHVTFHVGSVGTFVQGDNANAPTTTNSPGARVDQTSFSARQVGAQGRNAMASSNSLAQSSGAKSHETVSAALGEISRLRVELAAHLTSAEDAIAIGRVGEAEKAAGLGDVSQAARILKSAGPRVREIAGQLRLGWLLAQLDLE